MRKRAKKRPTSTSARPAEKAVLALRTEKRSWFSLATTGFGGVLIQYLKTVRERVRAFRTK